MKQAIIINILLLLSIVVSGQSFKSVGGVDNQARIGGVRIDSVKSLSGIVKDLTVTDIDGNEYKTVKIGSQIWMAENLKVTHEADGTAISLVADNAEWGNLGDNDTDKAYCYYNNDANREAAIYGALYAYAAAKNACPDDWHLPTDAEWTELENYISNDGHSGTEGTALKSTSGWNNDGNGTDDYGFSALPSGNRNGLDGAFDGLGGYGYWWSATEKGSTFAYIRYLGYGYANALRIDFNKSVGFSVRCVKD